MLYGVSASLILVGMVMFTPVGLAYASHGDIYQSRVPASQLGAAVANLNPVPPGPDAVARGRAVYFGKGLCTTCHSKDGTGAAFPGHRPRDFTNKRWWDARSDGELMWVLKNGSPGTGMPPRVGTVMTELEGWDAIHFIRSFAK
jgi:mono/diheme cytochrome c family protein